MSELALRSLRDLGIGPLYTHRLWGAAYADESFARLWPSQRHLLVSSYGHLWGLSRSRDAHDWRRVATGLYPTYTENDPHPMWMLAKLMQPTPHLYYADALVAFAHLPDAPPPGEFFDVAHRDGDFNNLRVANLHYVPALPTLRSRLLRTLYDARAATPARPPRSTAPLRLPPPDEIQRQRESAVLYITTYWHNHSHELPTLDELLASVAIDRPQAILELTEAQINLRRFSAPYPPKS